MKLKTFQTTNERKGRPIVRFSKKNGLFTFSKSAAKKIEIKAEDKLQFHHDQDSPKDWYMTIEKEEGLKIRPDKTDKSGFFMGSTSLKNELIKTLNIPEDCNSFIIGNPTELNGVKYWPLLLNKY